MRLLTEPSWGVSRRTASLLFLAPLIVIALAAAVRLGNRSWYRLLVAEDGPLEMFQLAGLAVSSLLSFGIAARLVRQARPGAALLYVLAGCGFFFGAGEEASWGQRWLGIETPAALAEVNEKEELSLHNVTSLTGWFDVGLKAAVGLYGGLGCWGLLWLRRRYETRPLEIFVVPVFLSSSFLVVMLWRALWWSPLQEFIPRGHGEIDETCIVFGATAFTALVWRRLGRRVKERQAAAQAAELAVRRRGAGAPS